MADGSTDRKSDGRPRVSLQIRAMHCSANPLQIAVPEMEGAAHGYRPIGFRGLRPYLFTRLAGLQLLPPLVRRGQLRFQLLGSRRPRGDLFAGLLIEVRVRQFCMQDFDFAF